jgi:FkbM family methyltransferase
VTFRRNGILWSAFAWDLSITPGLLEKGHYQGEEIRAVVAWLKLAGRLRTRCSHIVDVGANIGVSSIPFARQTNFDVLAIEPFPDNFNLLRQNVRQNGLEQRITCLQSAVSDQTGTVRMVLPEQCSGGAAIVTNAGVADATGRTAEVPAAGLKDIVTSSGIEIPRVALVWSDTEGSEAQVVATGAPLWSAGVPLYVEVYPEALEKQRAGEALNRLLPRFFDSFLRISDLITTDCAAQPIPIAEFSRLLGDLKRRGELTDVLLLPAAFPQ